MWNLITCLQVPNIARKRKKARQHRKMAEGNMREMGN
jgi:hypothetical protein